MYKLLIVEDEEIIRWGLKNEIPWNKLGFEVVGEAEDGMAALDIIPQLNPDTILLDIRMPVMDGMEFMSRVRDTNDKTKIVILSGYNEFEYARQSIEYGVFSYLLKPTKESQISEVFHKLKKELDLTNTRTRELENLKRKADSELGGDSENTPDEMHYGKFGGDEADPVIQKVKKYMSEHYNEKISLELLADFIYMNPSYFSVFFKQKTGYNYKDYLTMLRMEKAKDLLQNSRLKVYEIASMVGYDDFRYFSRLFKEITGINAHQFRSRPL